MVACRVLDSATRGAAGVRSFGRLLDYLEHTNQLENTPIVVVSDNGASGEGGPNGSVNEMKFVNGIPDDLEQNSRRSTQHLVLRGGRERCVPAR